MANMIDELFYGNLDLSLLDLKKGSDYYKTRKEISTILDALEDDKTKKQTERLRYALNDLDYVISRAYFTVGFRWGARIAMDIMSDESDIFSMPK